MDVLVRVQVRRLGACEVAELGELPPSLVSHPARVLDRNDLVQFQPTAFAVAPFAEIKMKPEAQRAMTTRVCRGFRRGRPSDHQAGTRDNALLVSFRDSAVDTAALAEIVGIHDQVTRVHRVVSAKSTAAVCSRRTAVCQALCCK